MFKIGLWGKKGVGRVGKKKKKIGFQEDIKLYQLKALGELTQCSI